MYFMYCFQRVLASVHSSITRMCICKKKKKKFVLEYINRYKLIIMDHLE